MACRNSGLIQNVRQFKATESARAKEVTTAETQGTGPVSEDDLIEASDHVVKFFPRYLVF